MVGIGPFIAHQDTPFCNERSGTLDDTLFYLALLRLMLPDVLLPATTALGTIHPRGREMGVLSGANVVMPNLSPVSVRKKYMLYDGKICTGDEAAECRMCLSRRMEQIGCEVVTDRGDYKKDLHNIPELGYSVGKLMRYKGGNYFYEEIQITDRAGRIGCCGIRMWI